MFRARRKYKMFRGLATLPLVWTLPLSAAGSLELIRPHDPSQWITPTAQISFRIPEDTELAGTPRIFIGKIDLTPLFKEAEPRTFRYSGETVPLPSGKEELIVYDQIGEDWKEIGRVSIKVLTKSGFESSEYSPRLDVTIDSQHDEGHSGDADAPERARFNDATLQAGFSGNQTRRETRINSSLNLSGASEREQALRFSEKGEDAPKVDLADYLVEIEKGKAKVSLGHVSYGQHPLLADSISNRGVVVAYQPNKTFDLSLASQNGTDIVGFSNPFGLKDTRDHNITSAAIGYEMLPDRPGAVRLEVNYVTASILPESDFDVGEVPDAEKSHGWGVRLLGNGLAGRLRGDMNYARASYTNPDDPFLSGDLDVVPVRETKNEARSATIAYDLLQKALEDGRELTVTVGANHERIDPLYKTLTAFPNSDVLKNSGSLNLQLGETSFSFQHSRQEDNLDNIPSLLKTETHSNLITAFIPLKGESSTDEDDNFLWPTLSITGSQVHQFAANAPDTEISDFNDGGHLPDQMNKEGSVGLEWSSERWDIAYTVNASNQDNRQEGRENADFSTLGHEIGWAFRTSEVFELGLSFARTRVDNKEEDIRNYTNSAGVNFNWLISGKWSLVGNFSKTLDDDSDNLVRNDSISNDVQIGRSFTIPFPGGEKRDGQFFIRYNQQQNDSQDNIFELDSFSKNWAVTSGLSFSLF